VIYGQQSDRGIGDCCFEISPALADEVKIKFPDYEDINQD
jgi:hypothetical protein